MKNERIFLAAPHMSGTEMRHIQEAFDRNYVGPLGPIVDAFEREFAERTGMAHTLALSSGTAAMHLAMRELGVGPGDTVIASTLTFIGSISPAAQLGAVPVFIDCDESTWNMDPDLLAEELAACARDGRLPKAVVPTDLYGQCCDIDRIIEICRRHNVPVAIDSAESVGAEYRGRHAGTGGTFAVYSFNGNKIITTGGGGMLASEDRDAMDHARFLSRQARDPAPHYEHSTIGYNYRMSSIAAAIGRGQLTVLDRRVKKKREIFDNYRQLLESAPGIAFMPETPYGRSNRWLTVILVDPATFGTDRETVRLALERENIEARPVWKPMHMQPVFKGRAFRGTGISGRIFEQGLCLPSGTDLRDSDQERIVSLILGCRKDRKE